MTNKYICKTCNKVQTTEAGIYSVMKTKQCVWHATGDKLRKTVDVKLEYPDFGLSGREEAAVRKMYSQEIYGKTI